MKKLLFCIGLLLIHLPAFSQNANRSGIFTEVGIGWIEGDTPMTSASLDGAVIKTKYIAGPGFNVSVGYRMAPWKQWAIEMKGVYQAAFKDAGTSSVAKIMPGAKWFWGNFSNNKCVYVGANIGVAFGGVGCKNENGTVVPTGAFENCKVGLAYEIEAGVMLSTHYYVGINFGEQSLPSHKSTLYNTRTWGLISAKFGYRF